MAYESKHVASDDPDFTALYEHRTAKDYAAYLLPHLKPDFHILDVGCGPGGITHDFSLLVPQGKVIGVDMSEAIVAQAAAKHKEPNISFEVSNACELSQFADASFDVVHAHAVFMHLTDPVRAFKAMYRVVKPGGIVATRDPSGKDIISVSPNREPFTTLISEYYEAHKRYFDAVGSSMNTGVYKEDWARQAGFGEDGGRIEVSASIERLSRDLNIFRGSVADDATGFGIVTKDQVKRWVEIWSEWTKEKDRYLEREFTDMLCFRGGESSCH